MSKKEQIFKKRINLSLKRPCSSINHGCNNIAMWEVSSSNGVKYSCGNSSCIKRAGK